MKKINFIQDEATPHNNIFIEGLVSKLGVDNVELYYSIEKSEQYSWEGDLSNAIKSSNIYGKKINIGLIWSFLRKSKQEDFFMVGWGNPTTKIIFLISSLLGFKLSMWFDYPNDKEKRSIISNFFRELFYFLLRRSNIKIYCVGKVTVNYFLKRRFDEKRLENLPIQVELKEIEKKLNNDELVFFTGSRLVKDKGYDILFEALSLLKKRDGYIVRIVGVGPEKENLENQVNLLSLTERVEFLGWLSPEDYMNEIQRCDVFIHPARVDAYGGSAIALALGTPVIGSSKAGAVIECVIDGENGFVYSPEDRERLAHLINRFLIERELVPRMSLTALKYAKKYNTEYWVDNFIRGLN